MPLYTVHPNQNLFDIALHLYGSIEGIFDLLITNQWLNMATDLQPGQSLEYHNDFVVNKSIVEKYHESQMVPSNGIRNVYSKRLNGVCVPGVIFDVSPNLPMVSFTAAGDGEMQVDWGDNADMEHIVLASTPKRYEHYFNSEVDQRRIRFFGEQCSNNTCCEYHVSGHLKYTFTYLDVSAMGGVITPTRPLIIDKFICQSNDYGLNGLFLFEGTYFVDIQNCKIDNLLPLVNLENLQELHLERVTFPSQSVLDEYLQALVSTPSSTGSRIGCKIYLTSEPTDVGYDAIRTILNTPAWNSPIQWEFYFNEQRYYPE